MHNPLFGDLFDLSPSELGEEIFEICLKLSHKVFIILSLACERKIRPFYDKLWDVRDKINR